MKKNLNLKKNSFLLLFLISFLASAFSQTPVHKNKNQYKALTEKQKQEKRDSIVNNSDYIFYGGTISEIMRFTDDSKKDVYIVTMFYVTDVIRGPQELKNTYIYRISKMHGYQYFSEYGFRRIHDYLTPMYRIFIDQGYAFCTKNTMSLQYLTDSSYIHPNYLNYEYVYNNLGFDIERSFICEPTSNIVQGITIDDRVNKTYKGLYGLHFANGQEVINYLLPYGNITHPIDTIASENK